ncbi:MAG: hypothetical protein ACK5O2_01440 [Microthrixaceae bacterium]
MPKLARFRLVVAIGATAAFVASCSVNPQPTSYGDDYEENFMLGCTGVDPDTNEVPEGGQTLAPEKDCQCIYDGLVEKVPFEEAKKFEEDQSEAESGADIEIPDNIAKIIADCTGPSGES